MKKVVVVTVCGISTLAITDIRRVRAEIEANIRKAALFKLEDGDEVEIMLFFPVDVAAERLEGWGFEDLRLAMRHIAAGIRWEAEDPAEPNLERVLARMRSEMIEKAREGLYSIVGTTLLGFFPSADIVCVAEPIILGRGAWKLIQSPKTKTLEQAPTKPADSAPELQDSKDPSTAPTLDSSTSTLTPATVTS